MTVLRRCEPGTAVTIYSGPPSIEKQADTNRVSTDCIKIRIGRSNPREAMEVSQSCYRGGGGVLPDTWVISVIHSRNERKAAALSSCCGELTVSRATLRVYTLRLLDCLLVTFVNHARI